MSATHQALALPTPHEVEDHAKSIGAMLAVATAAWALATRWHRKRQAASRMRRLEGKAVRYTLDAVRHVLYFIQTGNRGRRIDPSEVARQLALVSDVREELWLADGNESRREGERLQTEMLKVLTRAQAIRAQQQQPQTPDLFKDGWHEDLDK